MIEKHKIKTIITRSGLLLLVMMATGCAEYLLNQEGLKMMKEGNYDAGLRKLSEASAAQPRDASYRADYLRSLEETVNHLLDKANRENSAGRPDASKILFERVLSIDPENYSANLGLEELAVAHQHAVVIKSVEELLRSDNLDAAQLALKPVLLENPKDKNAIMLQRYIANKISRSQEYSVALQSKFKKPISLQFSNASLKLVFEALSRASGINILLDRDVKGSLKTTVLVQDVSVEDTIDIILMQNKLAKRVLNENSVFIYPKTPAKLKEYQELKIRSFHLVNADAKKMLVMIKTLLKTKDLFVHEKTNSLVMRDTPAAIRLAEKIIADQDATDPEVMLEVEVLEVSSSRLTELGIKLPDQITISPIPAIPTRGLTVEDLVGGVKNSDLSVNSLSAVLNMQLQDGEVNMLASPRIRVRNREKALILIGDRVPVITETTVSSTAGSTPTTNVNYLDVGLKLEVEPHIHADREVSIKLNLEVSNITRDILVGNTLAYQVGTRKVSTTLRLRDGETQVLAGLINNEDRNIASKIPGLGQMPVLGKLFSSERDDGKKTEIILSITPRIIGNVRLPEYNEMEFWSGTEASLRSKAISLKTVGVEPAEDYDFGMGRTYPAQDESSKPVPVKESTPSSAAVGTPMMAMSWFGPVQAKKGAKINLILNGQSDKGFNGLSFVINYDPSSLKVNEVIGGDYWKNSSATPTFTKTVDPMEGQVVIDVTQPVGQEDTKGKGSIVRLNFDVIGVQPLSEITVTSIKPSDVSGRELSATAPLPHNLRLRP
jgi:general secretion pathway protein D